MTSILQQQFKNNSVTIKNTNSLTSAKSEYRNLSRYYSTNSATPPYISTNGTVNTCLLIDKTKNNQYLTKNL